MLRPVFLSISWLGCATSAPEPSAPEPEVASQEEADVSAKPELTVACTVVEEEGRIAVAIRATNTASETLHVLDGTNDTAPYVRMSDGAVEVLFGIHPPPEDLDLVMVRIPTTRPLAPGDTLTHTAQVRPLILHDHYLGGGAPTAAPDSRTVRCRVGYGRTPLEAADQHTRSINAVLDWQQWAPDVMVMLPPG